MNNVFRFVPERASEFAGHYDLLWWYLVGLTVFFTGLIFVLVTTFGIKFLRKSESERPKEVHAPLIVEIIWIVIPFVIVMTIFFWGAALFVKSQRIPANAMQIDVIGKQWMWKVQHPGGQREINELHVPVGKPVRLKMISQDVIHDFGLPAFRQKMDVLPGRYTEMWFEPSKPGEYDLYCDQYCGTQHSGMIGKVVVLDQDKYEAWLAGAVKDETPVAAGQKLFTQYSCVTCHSQRAPSLAYVFGSDVKLADGSTVKADEAYIRESILNPSAKIVAGYPPLMPSYQGQLTEEQLNQLIAYIKTLSEPVQRIDDLKMLNRTPPDAVNQTPIGDQPSGKY